MCDTNYKRVNLNLNCCLIIQKWNNSDPSDEKCENYIDVGPCIDHDEDKCTACATTWEGDKYYLSNEKCCELG